MRWARFGVLFAGLAVASGGVWLFAQEAATNTARTPVFKSRVDLVVLSFTVTDNKGKYVNGLKPSDFKISEDGISQKLSTFSEGNRPAMEVASDGALRPLTAPIPTGSQANVIPAPSE